MDETAKTTLFCFFDNLLQLFEPFELLVKYVLIFVVFDLEFDISEAMFFKYVGNFRSAVDDIGELIDDEELKILNGGIGTNATSLLPR